MNSKDWTVGEGQKCIGSVQKKVAGLAVGLIDETVQGAETCMVPGTARSCP